MRETLSHLSEIFPLHASSRFAALLKFPFSRRGVSRRHLDGVLHKHRTIDEQLDAPRPSVESLADRDRALMRGCSRRFLLRLGPLGHCCRPARSRVPTARHAAKRAVDVAAQFSVWPCLPRGRVDLSVRLCNRIGAPLKYAASSSVQCDVAAPRPAADRRSQAHTMDIPRAAGALDAAYGEHRARDCARRHEPSPTSCESDAPHGRAACTAKRCRPHRAPPGCRVP